MLCYHFLILLYYRFNKFKFRRFQAFVMNQSDGEYRKLRFRITFNDMYVYRLMVIRIKHKLKPEKYEYRRHILSITNRFYKDR